MKKHDKWLDDMDTIDLADDDWADEDEDLYVPDFLSDIELDLEELYIDSELNS